MPASITPSLSATEGYVSSDPDAESVDNTE